MTYDKHLVRNWLFGAACVAALGSATPVLAADYYLQGPFQSNETGKGTPTNPFRSSWYFNHVLLPGDTLHVMPGTYPGLFLSASGSAGGGMVRYVGDPTSRPKIYVTSGNAIEVASGAHYIYISGFETQSTALNKNGVFLETATPVHHIVIDNIYAHDNSCAGISAIHADYLQVTNSVVANNAITSSLDCSGIDVYQLTNVDTAPGFHNVISGNIAYGNRNTVPASGMPSVTDGNGIILDDFDHTQNGYGSIAPAYTGATLVQNNITFNNGGRGIHVYFSNNVLVRNNTVYGNETSPAFSVPGFAEIQAIRASNVQIYNNVIYVGVPTHYALWSADSSNVTADYNIYYGGLAAWIQNSPTVTWGPHNVFANPMLKNPAINAPSTADFHLQSGSPALSAAIANAISSGPTIDFERAPRPSSGNIAAGAYQTPE
jgi:parallel beta-helix repeat protein